MLEYLDTVKENRTGITRYNQGLDSNSLNKTATGVSIITQAANQRLELIARIFAETGLSDLFRFLIKLNQLFVNQELVIRLTNGPLRIDPSDLDGQFDLVVNAGMGAGAKEQNLQNLQLVRDISTQLAQVGLSGPEQWYNLAKRIIEEVGFKNVDDFLMDPQTAAQQAQDKAKDEEPTSESLRASITDAPWQVQMQWWQKQGFQVSPDMFTEQAAQRAFANAVDAQSAAVAKGGNGNAGRIGALPTGASGAGQGGGSAPAGAPAAPGQAAGANNRPAIEGSAGRLGAPQFAGAPASVQGN